MQEDLLQNLDISSIMNKQKFILPFVGVFIAFIISSNIYKAQQVKMESLKKQIEEEGKVSNLFKVLQIQDGRFEKYKSMFGAKDFSLIMQKISEFAVGSEVNVLSFSPLSKSTAGVLTNLPLKIKIEGSYHKIGDFISKVESSPDVLKIANFQLLEPAYFSEGGKEVLSAEITVNAVYLTD